MLCYDIYNSNYTATCSLFQAPSVLQSKTRVGHCLPRIAPCQVLYSPNCTVIAPVLGFIIQVLTLNQLCSTSELSQALIYWHDPNSGVKVCTTPKKKKKE